MSNTVCLTSRQQKFYDYFVGFYKKNGAFPNPTEAARDLKTSGPSVSAMYGSLLLKGCFTNGQPIVSTRDRKHNTVKVVPLNIAEIKVEFKPRAKPQAKPKQNKEVQRRLLIAKLLMDLLGEDKGNAEFIQNLVA